MLTLGSLFDGIGGWLLAAKHAGVTPVWASEIDDFPAAVTARHFPDVKQLGDITKIDGAAIEPVDIICAGSPCQDLSVAGKRVGLAGERSGLFVRAVDIVREMRQATGGAKPRFFVWENVPGAFSSNHGRDFQAVLAEIGQTEVPMPKSGRWADAGLVRTHTCDTAWRVLDAQYWGVPQRRKRIFLVADFASAGRCAGEILFECAGVSGNTQAGTRAGQGAPGGAEGGARTTVYGICSMNSNSMKSSNPNSGIYKADTSRTLDLNGGTPTCNQGGMVIYASKSYSEVEKARVTASPRASGGNQGGRSENYVVGGSETLVAYDISHRSDVVRLQKEGTLPCLTARAGTGGNNLPVVHSYCIAGNTIDRQPQNGGNGTGNQEELAYTLTANDQHGVAQVANLQRFGQYKKGDVASTVKSRDYKDATDLAYEPCGTVRRLTPLECERLQGLPDGYTDIEFNGRPAPDSRRYKALGNGMAQPCADFVIRRIVESGKKGIDNTPPDVV